MSRFRPLIAAVETLLNVSSLKKGGRLVVASVTNTPMKSFGLPSSSAATKSILC